MHTLEAPNLIYAGQSLQSVCHCFMYYLGSFSFKPAVQGASTSFRIHFLCGQSWLEVVQGRQALKAACCTKGRVGRWKGKEAVVEWAVQDPLVVCVLERWKTGTTQEGTESVGGSQRTVKCISRRQSWRFRTHSGRDERLASANDFVVRCKERLYVFRQYHG